MTFKRNSSDDSDGARRGGGAVQPQKYGFEEVTTII